VAVPATCSPAARAGDGAAGSDAKPIAIAAFAKVRGKVVIVWK
jgi:hypothetical protein